MLDLANVLGPGGLTAVVQPVVRLADDAVVGWEALVRTPTGESPEHLLARAEAAGLRAEVELACLRAAVALGCPPAGGALFVNVGPAAVLHPALPALVGDLPPRLVLELTEHQALPEARVLAAVLGPLLGAGTRLAVDDTGSGYASLEHVVSLRPEFLKLSSRLVTGLHEDPARLALVRALAAFAREVGASVVAEGVEVEGERLALLAAGVEHAQGFLLGRPAPPWPGLAPRSRAAACAPLPLPAHEQLDGLVEALPRCLDARTACQAAVAHLAQRSGWMPSVYLHVAGRLRLQAQHGYWHVYDGMPVDVGVMGRTFTTGTTAFVRDVDEDDAYVDAVPGLRSELSVPLLVRGEVVGVVNVESALALPDSAETDVDAVVVLLARRLAEVGVPGESPARRLGRHTAALAAAAGTGDLGALLRAATTAVRELSGLDSALVALPGAERRLRVAAADGGLHDGLRRLDPGTLEALREGVREGQTGFTAGVPGGRAPVTQTALRLTGVRTVVTLPVGDGLLVAADPATVAVAGDVVDLLEVLAGQLSGCLQTVRAVLALRDRAERDPLTGLGNRASFRRVLDDLAEQPYALAYVDIDRFKAVNDASGHAEGDRLLVAVTTALSTLARESELSLFRLGGDEFAAVLPDADLGVAAARAARMCAAVRELGERITVSIGVAAAQPGEAVPAVLERADGALYTAKRGGRDQVRTDPELPALAPVLPLPGVPAAV